MTKALRDPSGLPASTDGLPASTEHDGPADPVGFLAAYPGYPSTAVLDRLRATEYSYLDAGGHVYLDYTGAGLPAQAQLSTHAERIRSGCFGNPHSANPASMASTELVEQTRRAVLAGVAVALGTPAARAISLIDVAS